MLIIRCKSEFWSSNVISALKWATVAYVRSIIVTILNREKLDGFIGKHKQSQIRLNKEMHLQTF